MRLLTVVSQHAAQLLGILLGVVAWECATKTAKKDDSGDEDDGESEELPHDGAPVAVVGPLPRTLRSVLLELVGTELVVDETAERNAVTEELERRDGVAEDEHGSENKEDILEHTREGEHERRGLANLENVRLSREL